MLTIAVPSWNSLEYLKILVASIKKNTKVPYEILIHNNGSNDGTYEWLKSLGLYKNTQIGFESSSINLGFCGVNSVLKCAKYPYTMIANADMYCLPGWDMALVKQIEKFKAQGIDKFTISCCLIEPVGGNPEYTIFNAGHDAASFSESILLGNYIKNRERWKKEDTVQWSHPILVPTEMLREINYLDEKYFPGYNVDNDLPRALYENGCRNFIMRGDSRVYHFSNKTFQKLPIEIRNKHGQDIFCDKWKIFTQDFRNRMSVGKKFQALENDLFEK